MTKQEHPYAQVLRWIADGETVEWQNSTGQWQYQDERLTLGEIREEAYGALCYRLKPRTININGINVPEPMRVAPELHSVYYLPDWSSAALFTSTRWSADPYDCHRMAQGLCHSTREAAEAHAKALLSFTTTETK